MGAVSSLLGQRGEPAPRVVVNHRLALPAVGRVVLRHEAGEAWAHVLVNRDGRVSGIVVRPDDYPETWPL